MAKPTTKRRSGDATYEVGYGKPPKETRFGARPQPQGARRSKRDRPDLAALLDQPIEIKCNGKPSKMHSHLAMLHGLFARAMAGQIRPLQAISNGMCPRRSPRSDAGACVRDR